jgi:uncharacterized protein (TIGR02145 family)
MKQITLLFTAIILSLATLAQAPQGINYQTVIRDGDGNILPDTDISLQMTILSGAPDGIIVYQETHDANTNAFGLINLVIGSGIPQSGDFAEINWGDDDKYLETAIDVNGSGTYIVLGTTQFLSVPYSYYSLFSADGVKSMTTSERDSLENPSIGMSIFNSTTNCLNYYSGTSWFEICGGCTPLPTQANAGPDKFNLPGINTTLEGNTPEFGTGLWTVDTGEGGVFEDANDPKTIFTGQACENYVLVWSISTSCGSNSDSVSIQFNTHPTVANAGDDQIFLNNTLSFTLSGNIPQIGDGIWTIQSGKGGNFEDPTNATTFFTGQPCETYILRWTISTPCNESLDEINVEFYNTPTVSDAGPDQGNIQGNTAILQANSPENGLGVWSIISGEGGSIQNPENPGSLFIGQQDGLYELQWEISTECISSRDTVIIGFGNAFICGFPLVDSRDNQQYETVQIGEQCWMRENLNTGEEIHGSLEMANNSIIEKYCYNNDPSNCDIYGAMYQWNEMMQYDTIAGIQGICPDGWHIPTDDEWDALITYLGGSAVAGGKLKETGLEHWVSPNTGATNSSGFTGLPAGNRYASGDFGNMGYKCSLWSSTKHIAPDYAYGRHLSYNKAKVDRNDDSKAYGMPVRCIKDND